MAGAMANRLVVVNPCGVEFLRELMDEAAIVVRPCRRAKARWPMKRTCLVEIARENSVTPCTRQACARSDALFLGAATVAAQAAEDIRRADGAPGRRLRRRQLWHDNVGVDAQTAFLSALVTDA